ncbi:MAG: response regulator [Deltaproteobacteria bacterium]|nr:response regulator [Deltaproteobacteria bacterium]
MNSPYILLIDDSPDDRALTIRELQREFPDVSVKEIIDSQGLSETLEAGGFDLVITDYQLHWTDGLKVLNAVKASRPDCPVIMFTGTGTEEVAVRAMQDGLDEYVLKSPKHFIRMPVAVKAALEKARRAKVQKEAEEALRQSERNLSIRNRISQIFLTVPDEEMYAEVLKVILEVMESKYGVFGYIDEAGNYVCPSMTRDIWKKCQIVDKTIVFPCGSWGGIWGQALTEKKSIYSNKPFKVPEGHLPITRAMDVPIVHKENVIANLLIANKKSDYDEKDLELLEAISNHIAPVLNARLQRDKRDRERRQAEGFIKNILESVGEGFSVIDRDYRIVTANKAFGCQSKIPVEDIRGKHCYEISHRTDRPCYETGEECPTRYTFETGKPYSVVHTHKDKDGGSVYVEVRSYPMKDDSGNVVSVIEVTNDITEKRKLGDQLRQAQKMEAIGQLAGGIAHDFNNILTAIIGYSNILQMKMSEDDPLRTEIDHILSSSHRAAQLTQSLLAFSRQQIIHPKPIRLNEIIDKVEKLLLRLIGEDIELKTILADKDLTIMADSGQIEQVLMNLATNARDAMPEGGILTVGTEVMNLDDMFIRTHGYDVKPGEYAVISVTDTGEGMDESTRKRIFEPFFTTKEMGRGTGLGLSIIYGIVTQHQGIINVYSEPGKGTTFKIYLPVIKLGVEEAEKETLPPPKGGTETVLVAEDNKEVRQLLRIILERLGYKVVEAVDGQDAVIKFKENRDKIDLAVLDVIMPTKNGKMAYEEITKMRPGMKAIFMSGYSTDIIDKKGILEEGVNFVQKPIAPNELLRKVREVLDK